MKQEEHNAIVEKSKTKRNGVYTYKTYLYLVFDKQLAGWCDYSGNIYECSYGFNISKGKVKDRFVGKEVLKAYLKQYSTK